MCSFYVCLHLEWDCIHRQRGLSRGIQRTWVWILPPLPNICVILDKMMMIVTATVEGKEFIGPHLGNKSDHNVLVGQAR